MTILKLKEAFGLEKETRAYLECYFCGKKFKCDPKKSVLEEAKRHKLWLITIKSPEGYEENFFVCEKCAVKVFGHDRLFGKKVSLKEFRKATKS